MATVFTTVTLLLHLTAGSVRGQAPSTTAWGPPSLEGIWLDVYATPLAGISILATCIRHLILERAAELGDREFATAEERAARDQVQLDRPPVLVSGAYNAVYTSAKPAGPRTSLVVDPPNGRIPALTPEAQRQNDVEREWRLMLLRNTETCRNNAPACAGREYGPPSPRRFDAALFYNTAGRMNRHDGPEDQSLGDRCMSRRTPDLNGFRRIVQGDDSIAMGYDTGQGQGVPARHLPERELSAEPDPSAARGLTWPLGGGNAGHRDHKFLPKFPFQGSGENRRLVERYTRVDEDTLEYEVTIEDPTVWTVPWTVRQELKRQSDEQNRVYYEPRCHEGNYGLPALLLGARMDEQAFAEGRGPDPFSFSIFDTAALQRP